jgi:DNA-binding protein Fis
MSYDPYAKTTYLSTDLKAKMCQRKFKDIRQRIAEYYQYTDGRIKPEDLYEMCLYKREAEKLVKELKYEFRRNKLYACSRIKWDTDVEGQDNSQKSL